jgi:ketosteroid isomerase-like protein
MRYPSTAFLLLSLCSAPLCGQASRGPPPKPTPIPGVPRTVPATTSGTQARLALPIKLEDEWTTALVKRDTRMFDLLLAPNFVYTENASVMDRDDVMKSVTGSDRVEWARNEGMRVHDFGDVQVITGVLHFRGKGKQGRFDRRYRFTDTWQRRNDRWQIIAAQDYLIPK